MTTKQALSNAMHYAAAHCNRLVALKKVAEGIPEEQFIRLVNQHPSTIPRDLECAKQDFERARKEYEEHCKSIGEPAYVTYNED